MKCPYCGSTKYKTLLKGVPRCCYRLELEKTGPGFSDEELLRHTQGLFPVVSSGGKWYKAGPIRNTLAAFAKLMSAPHQYGPDYKMDWREQMKTTPAVIKLLDYCGWDEEVALEFLRIRHRRWFSNKRCANFYQMIAASQMSFHLALAREAVGERRKKASLQEKSITSLMGRANVFASAVDAM